METAISAIEKAGKIVRKLNYPIYKLEFAAAGEITDLENNKQTFSFFCKKKIGLLAVVLLVFVILAALAAKKMKKKS